MELGVCGWHGGEVCPMAGFGLQPRYLPLLFKQRGWPAGRWVVSFMLRIWMGMTCSCSEVGRATPGPGGSLEALG